MTLEFHPYAELFPLIEGDDFERFAADIRDHGLRERIVLLGGRILDGRNRYRAAVRHGLAGADGDAAWFRDFDIDTDGDPLAWVLSKNLARRHLDESQRAMVAARLANLSHGGDRKDQAANLPLDPKAAAISQDQAAAALHVSARLLRAAKVVQERASAELRALVDRGMLAVSQAAIAAKLDVDAQARVAVLASGGKANAVRTAIKQGAREIREQALGKKQQALPDRKYGVILADPEWQFTTFSAGGQDRSPANHYPTSSEQVIAARDVQKLAAIDAMLALWTTDLARGIRIMEAWGFTQKSYFVWAKDIVQIELTDAQRAAGLVDRTFQVVGAPGNGYWNRDRDEILLIGTRGAFVAPAMGTQPESIWFAARPRVEGSARGRHSAKPEDAHLWIEQNWPSLPKIELNARSARPGWDVWGYEAPAADIPHTENVDGQEIQQNQASDENRRADQIAPAPAPARPKFMVLETADQILDPVTGAMPLAAAFDAARDIPHFMRRSPKPAPKAKKDISA